MSILKKLWKDESAQGATEYILMLVAIVALAMMFKTQIVETIKGKMGSLKTDIDAFTSK